MGEDESRKARRHAPAKIKGLMCWIPFHSQEAVYVSGEERKSPYFMYFFLSCFTHRLSELESSFQPSLAIRAKLNSCIFLNPSPPSTFGVQKEFQDFKERFQDL
jgi:hypothetical protein